MYKRMEFPELSLAPNEVNNASRKRKLLQDHALLMNTTQSVDLQLKDPLPLDWEQCLDLQSGKMYYYNRKTLKKSSNWPIPMPLDLGLNISTLSGNDDRSSSDHAKWRNPSAPAANNTVALACLNCHLLVILSKSSPSCPNCKYVHSLQSQGGPTTTDSPPKLAAVKSFNTLSLLN